MTDIALIFPGQGSQKPGMAKDLVDAFPAAAEVFSEADATLGYALSTLCFDGPAETLMETHHAQPALLTHGVAVWRLLQPHLGARIVCAAGHSLGEFTAHVAAGTFDFATAVALVRTRGELMQAAGVARPGAMAAILGDIDVRELCEQASREAGAVVPANYNSPGQVVVSGEVAGVERLIQLANEHGARKCMRLQVSGAFHSPLMDAARPGWEAALAAVTMHNAGLPVYANVTGRQVMAAKQSRRLLGAQMTSPVRWTDIIRNIVEDHPGITFIELGPGQVLGGLIRKISPESVVLPAGTAAHVEAILSQPGA